MLIFRSRSMLLIEYKSIKLFVLWIANWCRFYDNRVSHLLLGRRVCRLAISVCNFTKAAHQFIAECQSQAAERQVKKKRRKFQKHDMCVIASVFKRAQKAIFLRATRPSKQSAALRFVTIYIYTWICSSGWESATRDIELSVRPVLCWGLFPFSQPTRRESFVLLFRILRGF